MGFVGGLAADNARLWIADGSNKRVVRHENAATKANGAPANGLLGELAFGTPALSQFRFGAMSLRGVAIDPESGKVFVCEWDRHRVLWFNDARTKPIGAQADGVLGKPDFSTSASTDAWNSLSQPSACAVDPGGRLWVCDAGKARVLRFTPALESTVNSVGMDGLRKFYMILNARIGERFEIHSSSDLKDWSTVEASLRYTSGPAGSNFTLGLWIAPTAASGNRSYRLQVP